MLRCQKQFLSPRDLIDHLLSECFEISKGEWECSDANCKDSHELKRCATSRALMSPVHLWRRLSGGRKRGRNPSTEPISLSKRGRVDMAESPDGSLKFSPEMYGSTPVNNGMVNELDGLPYWNMPPDCYHGLSSFSTPAELDACPEWLSNSTEYICPESSASAMAPRQQLVPVWSTLSQDSTPTLGGDSPEQKLQRGISTNVIASQTIVSNRQVPERLETFYDFAAIDPRLTTWTNSSRKDSLDGIGISCSNNDQDPWSTQSLQHNHFSPTDLAQGNSVTKAPQPDPYTTSSPVMHRGSVSEPSSTFSYGNGKESWHSPDSGLFNTFRRQSAPEASQIRKKSSSFAHVFHSPVSFFLLLSLGHFVYVSMLTRQIERLRQYISPRQSTPQGR